MSTTTAYLLYAIFVVGAVGLYCLMPRRDGSRTVVGVVVGASSVISLLMLLAIDVIDPDLTLHGLRLIYEANRE